MSFSERLATCSVTSHDDLILVSQPLLVKGDLAEERDTVHLMKETVDRFGRLNILVIE